MRRTSRPGAALILAATTAAWTPLVGTARAAGGEDIALHGNSHGAPACSSCHGIAGEGQPQAGFPRLAGLDADYLRSQLSAIALGSRNSEIMTPVAKALTESERRSAASYFAGLASPKAAEKAPNVEIIAAGARIAQDGEWSKGLPGCAQCHGAAGLGVGADFPKLAAQSALYLSNQLQAWKTGARSDDPMGLMRSVAAKLSDRQVTEVAAYYASLPIGGDAAPKGSEER